VPPGEQRTLFKNREVVMDSLGYAKELVSYESTSVLSNVPVTDCAEDHLKSLGFLTERLEYQDGNGITKACVVGRKGPGKGGMAYFGHTDVVPADPWFTDEHGPFEPTVVGDRLYGAARVT
jgi:acetylornithine deacetylase